MNQPFAPIPHPIFRRPTDILVYNRSWPDHLALLALNHFQKSPGSIIRLFPVFPSYLYLLISRSPLGPLPISSLTS